MPETDPAPRTRPLQDLKDRTRQFAVRIIKLCAALPATAVGQIIGKQLLRSGTSVGANYREGIRARSCAEYASKLQISLMELEETAYWLELLVAAEIVSSARLVPLEEEASELTAIFVSLIKKLKGHSSS